MQLIVFCLTLYIFLSIQILTSSDECFEIHCGIYVVFYAGGIFCSMSSLVCAFQVTIVRARSKRAFVYPWITWCILGIIIEIGVIIQVLLKYNFPVSVVYWKYLYIGLVQIVHCTCSGLIGFLFVQSLMEIPIELDEISIPIELNLNRNSNYRNSI